MTKTSIGLQELQKRIADKAKADPSHRFWGLYTHVWKLDELSSEIREGTYRPLPCRPATIPKEGGKSRMLKIPAIRDRIVQGALKLILEPIFEADFQPGSYGYRPGRKAHDALDRVRHGLNKKLYQVIDVDLAAYFDSIRHDLLLKKIAERVRDPEILALCKKILKASGKRGVPQGSVIGPLWANLFLNDVDKMLEQAQDTTAQGSYEVVRYTRYADDLVILVSAHVSAQHWVEPVERRLREELAKLELTLNEEKTRIFDLRSGEPFDFLGYTFRWVAKRGDRQGRMVLTRPQKKKRTRILRTISNALRRNLHREVGDVVRNVVNPIVRGWANFFCWGNAGRDLTFVRWQVDEKIRRFASRQRPKHKKQKGWRPWTKWSAREIYGEWGLFDHYKVIAQ